MTVGISCLAARQTTQAQAMGPRPRCDMTRRNFSVQLAALTPTPHFPQPPLRRAAESGGAWPECQC